MLYMMLLSLILVSLLIYAWAEEPTKRTRLTRRK